MNAREGYAGQVVLLVAPNAHLTFSFTPLDGVIFGNIAAMAYYPPPGSHVQPVVYTGSHHSHHPSQLGYAAPYPQQLQYVPSHHSGHVYAAPQVMAPQVIMVCAPPMLEVSFPSYTSLQATGLHWQRPPRPPWQPLLPFLR